METILTTAAAIVDGDRERTYGSPRRNLDAIAGLWSEYLIARGHLDPCSRLQYDDVALMMTLLKVARLANDPGHRDSQVDACGYMRLLERCQGLPAPLAGAAGRPPHPPGGEPSAAPRPAPR